MRRAEARGTGRRRSRRRAAAALELALLLPTLCFLCLIATDYPRLFYSLATLSDCARAGAMYYATHSTATTAAIQQAALADATNLSPAPTVTTASGTDSSGNAYVQVTVSCTFRTLTANPAIPSPVTLSRTFVMMPNPP